MSEATAATAWDSNAVPEYPGMEFLRGAIDSHVHCCPHINLRTVSLFDAV